MPHCFEGLEILTSENTGAKECLHNLHVLGEIFACVILLFPHTQNHQRCYTIQLSDKKTKLRALLSKGGRKVKNQEWS